MNLQSQQVGQAMTEFVVVCVILVPLFVLLPLLGKYIDVNHATIKASRYVAWERAVGRGNGDTGEIARETRRRYFSREDIAIKTKDGSEDSSATDKNPFWVDSKNKPLLKSFDDVKISFAPGVTPALAPASVATAINRIADDFGLVSTGVFTATVQADTGKAEAQNSGFKNLSSVIPLSFNSRTAIIGDVWAAKDTNEVDTKTKGKRVMAPLRGSNVPQTAIVNDVILAGKDILFLFEPTIRDLEVQRVRSEIVPEIHLGPYQGNGQ